MEPEVLGLTISFFCVNNLFEDPNDTTHDIDGKEVHPWITLQVELVADCRIFTLQRYRRASPLSGKVGEFNTISSANWVNVVALTDEGNVVMIRQYRHGSNEITLEIPGGIIDDGETPEQAGRRELLEETGFAGEDVQVIGVVRPNPALFDNYAYTVLISGVRRVARPTPDEHEEIAVQLYSLKDTEEMVRRGEITHSLVLNAFLWLRIHRENGAEAG